LVTAAQMLVWLGLTTRGDDEELHHGSRGHEFWRTVESDTDSCLNRACPWFKKCFYHRARNEANAADVIITNHSMLFVDMKAENRLLPAYNHLVIDEAHHFEEVASRHLGRELFYTGFVGTLVWLYKDSRSGLLPFLKIKLQQVEAEEPEAGGWIQTLDTTMAKLVEIKLAWDEFCELLYTMMVRIDSNPSDSGQLIVRVKNDTLPPHWDKLMVMEDNLFLAMGDVTKPLNEMLAALKEKQDDFGLQSAVTDLAGALKNLADHRDVLRFFMQRKDENYVYWVEAGGYMKSKSLQLVAVPKDVGPLLNQYFFSQKDCIVMTSATLSVDKSFTYTGEQMGLDLDKDADKVKSVLLPSPFNYRQQALVMIPRDFPSIKGAAGEQRFTQMLAESLSQVAVEMNGRMLVLFTSYRMLKQVHPELKERLSGAGIHVLGQGIDSNNRSKLTVMFQQNSASVLLGTSSFWEGVDIPGNALSCLAIVRLPFQPPTHPLVEAKCEELTKQKQNPFMKLSVPQAVIRFKQGFGRLVRSARDKGVVIVYDTRVIDTTYGKYFLYSLPGPKIEHMPTAQLVSRIKEWMKEEA
jgi:ATP-dependent DNA helicase DinG